eukprot:jgi/Botrbrau1/9032/Bobra.0376s0009.1
MHSSMSSSIGGIAGSDPQARLESDFQLWLTSKRVCWDLLYLLVTISYVIAYLREGCPRFSHLCGYSSFLIILLCLTGIGLIATNRPYHKMRQFIFAGVWYTTAAAGFYPHMLLEQVSNLSGKPGTAFLMMLLLKVPPLILLYSMFPVRVEWAPLVQILTTIMYHIASMHAAAQYASTLQYNFWVQQLVTSVNRLVLGFFKATFVVFGEPPAEILAELELPEAFLSTGQCLLCMWVLIQASVSWTCLILRSREEMNERRAFLASSRLPYRLHWDFFREEATRLAAVHFLVCVYLVTCYSLFGVTPPQNAQQGMPHAQ